MAKPVSILVTGFGPFDGTGPGNLSYSVVTTLPKYLPPTPTCRVPVQVFIHPYDIPVAYNEVRTIVPRLYDAYAHQVDIWLHFGMRPHQDLYSIEQLGRRDGYDTDTDITGFSLPKDESDGFFRGCPKELESTLDVDNVFQRWRSKLLDGPEVSPELGAVRIRQSRDPGHFICDFLHYSVLAEHWRRKNATPNTPRTMDLLPVMFLNVPTKNTVDQLRRARHVTICLMQALAESWDMHRNTSAKSSAS
ncbi:peptidase C15, pyroglutamyl peptidase I-like protein [Aureobasidium pullulans EXF-150]|uniref:Peptidase C15, pyroglutamyl peptidase I-like protein n=1 Tax=Aureobasidium pullulans EXF-150 TaxID=1043002 RepID=A0A074XCT9_AURPU|nr:peptidase C15, pyroglutamyl peptidase I-like protein [Aureobasidium pullulans EXF-150]KEQ79852.1 peptidase C15, pyroglutamyl peptidase I-like protein [Aureobasidium pullulans EXF-150]